MTEDQLEQEALGWLAEAGYATLSGRTSRQTVIRPIRRAQS